MKASSHLTTKRKEIFKIWKVFSGLGKVMPGLFAYLSIACSGLALICSSFGKTLRFMIVNIAGVLKIRH